MNCANHFDRERAAFCQHCGKPLCTECVRNVGTSVFCEPCLTARVASTAPPSGPPYPGSPYPGYPQTGPAGYPPAGPPPAQGAPNPGLAALLGFIPGVGAMYNEQYAKGIVHLVVFAVLVSLTSDVNGIFLLFVFGWEFYMAIEAHHTARARRDGTPLPNPFGLNDLSERLGFGKAWPSGVPNPAQPGAAPNAGASAPDPNVPTANPYSPPYSYSYVPPTAQWAAPPDASAYAVPPIPSVPPMPPYPDPNLPYYRRFPSAAIWLIALGAIFLLGNIPVFHVFRGRLVAPFVLIGLGVWLFVRRMVGTGPGFENDGSAYYQWRLQRAIRGGAWLILFGVIWLLDALRIFSWSHSWPLFLIGAGVLLFLKRTMHPGIGYGYPPPASATPPPAAPVTTTELAPVDSHAEPGSSNQEGR
jgi:hypothetical protein